MKYHNDYSKKWYFERVTEIFEVLELEQLITGYMLWKWLLYKRFPSGHAVN